MTDHSPKPPQSSLSVGERFHDMDSLRACMMLLGIVFHAAWFFVPIYFGHTLSDRGGATGYLYFFAWVHQFRMQVFFLIAGFFACLLIEKRGVRQFVTNRWKRVVIPFFAVLLTLYPLMKLQYIRGGNISGRILSDKSVWQQFVEMWPGIDWWNEWPVHFWFLETLILIYAISVGLKLLFDSLLDRQGRLRGAITEGTNLLTQSHWGPFVFAIPLAIPLAYDLTWFGIDSGPFYPMWAGVFAYWLIFAIGWCLYKQPDLIDGFVARWPAYLIVGSLISVLLCGYFNNLMMSGKISWFYPVVLDIEMDYAQLRPKLLAAAESNAAVERQGEPNVDEPNGDEANGDEANGDEANGDEANGDEASAVDQRYYLLWTALEPRFQEFIRGNPAPNSDQLSSLAEEITRVAVFNPDFIEMMSGVIDAEVDSNPQVAALAKLAQSSVSDQPHNPAVNRELLASLFPTEFFGRWVPPWTIRIGYFYAYALATWFMVFAMLGLFRRFLHHPSPTMRYLADSSYWLYLLHLPVQFEISLYGCRFARRLPEVPTHLQRIDVCNPLAQLPLLGSSNLDWATLEWATLSDRSNLPRLDAGCAASCQCSARPTNRKAES